MRKPVVPTLVVAAALALLPACDKSRGAASGQGVAAAAAAGKPSAAEAPAAAPHEEGHHAHAGAPKADRELVDADGVVRRGAPLTAGPALAVSDARRQIDALQGKRVKVTGKVSKVCQPMGCWLVIQGEAPGDTIRITTHAHDVFVPKGAMGRIAVVEGELVQKTLDTATAQHLADDADPGAAKKVEAPVQEVTLYATALELKPL